MINVFGKKEALEPVEDDALSFPSLEATVKKAMERCVEMVTSTKLDAEQKVAAVSKENSETYLVVANVLQKVDKVTQAVDDLKHDLPGKLMDRCDESFTKKDDLKVTTNMVADLQHSIEPLTTSIADHGTALTVLEGKVNGLAIVVEELRKRTIAVAVTPVAAEPKLPKLSERQQQIYDLLKAGKSQVETATQLGIAQASVAGHVASIRLLGYSL
jgi:tetrahydromethanopterin S-methyltransferase subunit B